MRPEIAPVILGAYTQEAKNLFAAITDPPPAFWRKAVDDCIRALKVCTAWPAIDMLHVPAAPDSQAMGQNWKSPGTFTLSLSGTTTFTAYRSIAGNAVDGVASTGYNPATSSLGMAQNDSHAGVYCLATSTSAVDDLQADNGRIGIRARDGTAGIIRQSATTGTTATTGGTNPFHAMGIRRDSSNQLFFVNGVQDRTAAVASVGLPSTITYLGNGTLGNFTNRPLAICHVGKALTDAQALGAFIAFRAYLRALGAVS